MKIDPKETIQEIRFGLLNQLYKTNKKGFVVGLSGGVDSSVTAALASNVGFLVWGVSMPSYINSANDLSDAINLSQSFDLIHKVVQIDAIAEEFDNQMLDDIVRDPYDMGNLYSEVRAIVLSRIAAKYNLIMLNTGNKDEDLGIGYCTKRGDNLGDLAPIGNLPKRLVRELGRELGIPGHIVNKVPTAGLFEGQTDESELGYCKENPNINMDTYEMVEVVTNGLDQGIDEEVIAHLTGISINTIIDISGRHCFIAPHKHEVAPPAIPISYTMVNWSI